MMWSTAGHKKWSILEHKRLSILERSWYCTLIASAAALLLVRSHSLILSMALLARLVSSIPTKHSRRQHDQGKTSHSKLRTRKVKQNIGLQNILTILINEEVVLYG